MLLYKKPNRANAKEDNNCLVINGSGEPQRSSESNYFNSSSSTGRS